MKKQYIQPNIVVNQMVCIQSDISILTASKGINTTQSKFTAGNSDNIEIGTKERNEWGNIGGDDMTYGSIW